jgi:AcrR family transcriptional regulator
VSIIPAPPARQAGTEPDSPWRTGGKRRRDRELKRDAVIRAAARAFDTRGFHNTSLADIALALQVTKPTLYYYVENKEDLLFQCFLAGLEGIERTLAEALESHDDGRTRLRRVLRGYALAIASEYGWCMVRAADQDLGPERGAQVKARKAGIDQGIRRLIRAGIDDGSLGTLDPKLTAFAIAGALNWIAHWHRQDSSLRPETIAEEFIGFFERGLLPRPPQHRPSTP